MTSKLAERLLGNRAFCQQFRQLVEGFSLPRDQVVKWEALVSLVEGFSTLAAPFDRVISEWVELKEVYQECYFAQDGENEHLAEFHRFWLLFDAGFSSENISVGELFSDIVEALGTGALGPSLGEVVRELCRTRMGVYQSTRRRTVLRELITNNEFRIHSQSGLQERVLFARLAPPSRAGSAHRFLFLPFLLSGSGEIWETRLKKKLGELFEVGVGLRQLMENGTPDLSWHEFVCQGFAGEVAGLPLLQGDLDGNLSSRVVSESVMTSLVQISLAKNIRSLLADLDPGLQCLLEPTRTGKMTVTLDRGQLLNLVRELTQVGPALKGRLGETASETLQLFGQALQEMEGPSPPASEALYPEVSDSDLLNFMEAAMEFFDCAPELVLERDEFIRLDGHSPFPIFLSVAGKGAGYAGLVAIRWGEGTREAVLRKEHPEGTVVLSYHQDESLRILRSELERRGLPFEALQAAPHVVSSKDLGGASDVRLMTAALNIALVCAKRASGSVQTVGKDGRAFTIRWPVSLGDSGSVPTASRKLGRNEPCWCGSGKKYKKCHYETDRA